MSSGVAVHPPELADARDGGFAGGGVTEAEPVGDAQPALLRPPKITQVLAYGTVAVLVGVQLGWLVLLALAALAIARL
jgi:hypothetical protein